MKKQIIGSVLILLVLLGLFILVRHKSYYDMGVYGFTMEMFYCFGGAIIFLVVLVTGALVFRKKKLIYWSITWGTTSIIAGALASWAFVRAANPTESGWGAYGEGAIYYLTGSLLSQAAVLLATLGVCTSRIARVKLLSWFISLCLVLTSAIVLLYMISLVYLSIISDGFLRSILGVVCGILLNPVPLCITIPLILFILKEKKVRAPENK